MSKQLFILALAIFALVGFTTLASAGAGKVLGPGGSTTCNGDIVVKSKTGGNYPRIAVISNGKTRTFELNPGFLAPQQMEFTKQEREAATGGSSNTTVKNVSAGGFKVKVTCD